MLFLFGKFVLVRRVRPMIPAISNTPMPDHVALTPEKPSLRKEEQGRRYCVYMRPWTLLPELATVHVPYITNLNQTPQQTRRRLRTKTAVHSFARAWSWYIHGQIVSQHQTRIIRKFMEINCGNCTRDANVDIETEGSGVKACALEFDNQMCVNSIHRLIRCMLSGKKEKDGENEEKAGASSRRSIELGNDIWGLTNRGWAVQSASADDIISDSTRQTAAAPQGTSAPKKKTINPQLKIHPYVGYSHAKEKQWFIDIMDPRKTKEIPKKMQLEFLRAVANRCRIEAEESN